MNLSKYKYSALGCCFVAEAQLRTIKPSSVYKVPNISHATYKSKEYNNEDNPLYWDLHCSPYTTPGTQIVVASSVLSSQGSASYRASNIIDCNHETAWVEGVSGYGVGQWIEFRDSRSMQVFPVQDFLGGKHYINKLRFEIMDMLFPPLHI